MTGKNVFALSPVVAVFFLSTPAPAQLPAPDDLGHCGGLGQRACCVFEAFPSCDLLVYETGEISSETCRYLGIFPFPAGVCGDAHPDALDYCGADGQRACCAGESPADIPCDTGSIQNFNGPGGTCGGDATFPGAGAGTCGLLSSPCGGHLERVCLPFPTDVALAPCDDDGLIAIRGCVGPRCGPSTSWCYRPTSCGGDGQRACCGPNDIAGSAEFCGPGLGRIPGVAGEATCGLSSVDDSAPFTGVSLEVCRDPHAVQAELKDMQEPADGWVGDKPSEEPDCSLPGFADLHAHLFAHLAFGGRVVAGAPFSQEEGGVKDALKEDADVHGNHSLEAHPLGAHTQEGDQYTTEEGFSLLSTRVAIEDDCLYSSKTWLQKYRYALDAMGAPVALGSDWNGIASHIGPRFGHDACGLRPLERARQERLARRLGYPFELEGFGSFDRQVTGLRTFDFNVDGLAHVGLLPDFIADLRLLRTLDAPGGGTVGEQRAFLQERLVSTQIDFDLDKLYRSASAFVDVWERAEGSGDSGTGGGDFLELQCEDRTESADESCTASVSIASDAMGDLDGLVQTPPGPYPLGDTVVTLSTNVDVCGAPPASCVSTVTVVDRTKPSITCPQPVTVECEPRLPPLIFPDLGDGPPSQNEPIQLPAGTPASHATPIVTDSCGFARWTGCVSDFSVANNYPLGSTPVTCSASDGASKPPNVETCEFPVNVVDTRAPSITCPEPIVTECTGGDAALVTPGVATGSDVCSGVDITTHGAASFPRGSSDLTYKAVDSVGLEASCVAKVTVEDTKPPTIQCPADAIAECTGASSAPVDLGAAEAADVCGDVSVSTTAGKRFPLGATTVTFVATDEVDLTSSCMMKVTVEDTTAPTIQCPADVVAECTGESSAAVDVGAAQASDICGGVSIESPTRKRFPLGPTTLTHVATDDVELTSSCTNKVTVQDTTPPPITSAAASPNKLWPPDKKMRVVAVAVSSTDRCDSAAAVCEITGVRSNEPIVAWSPSLKSKDTWDWKKTAPLSLELRSWRTAKSSPRVYSIDLACRDRAGNASTSTATVTVPLSQ